jgi:hypothetical protein
VDEPGGVERVARPPPSQLQARKTPEVVVDEGDEALERRAIARTVRDQQCRDIGVHEFTPQTWRVLTPKRVIEIGCVVHLTVQHRPQEPADLAAALERGVPLPDGPGQRFIGYAILGVTFRSGDVLALRRFPVTSHGPGYTSVWHRSPDGGWTVYTDVPPDDGCARYFGPALREAVVAPIRLEWTGFRSLTVAVDGGRTIAWSVALTPTASTAVVNRLGAAMPRRWRTDARMLRVVGAAAGVALRAGRLSLAGRTPDGSQFLASPDGVWVIAASRATIGGRDLGPTGPIAPQPALGEFHIPNRGLFAFASMLLLPGERLRA